MAALSMWPWSQAITDVVSIESLVCVLGQLKIHRGKERMYFKSQNLYVDAVRKSGDWGTNSVKYYPRHLTVAQNYKIRRQQLSKLAFLQLKCGHSSHVVIVVLRPELFLSSYKFESCHSKMTAIKETDSWPACHHFDPSTAEEPACRGN
ncbi:hypothetical protein TNCV_2506271 [Trichonephila clavipes]|uniref:Uncharacterized protein n=1 Tax=Trichonephila clavipes TaxID=2585209 RepID=A0A8X7BL64_TRICX|nr:hypothetical protein TNCV_2506271 [Trichonephila clavipes]